MGISILCALRRAHADARDVLSDDRDVLSDARTDARADAHADDRADARAVAVAADLAPPTPAPTRAPTPGDRLPSTDPPSFNSPSSSLARAFTAMARVPPSFPPPPMRVGVSSVWFLL